MYIRILSDVHSEFTPLALPEMEFDAETVLVLAGDIGLGHQVHSILEGWASRFKDIVFVLGNHEYYKNTIPKIERKIKDRVAHLDNVHVLQAESVKIGDVTFIGATLWTDMGNMDHLMMYHASNSMSDYKTITFLDRGIYYRKLLPIDTVNLHGKHRTKIFDILKETEGKTVVVTHHVPSYQSIHKDFKNDNLNGAYASELFEDIHQYGPDIWIHGHTHSSSDYMINTTNVICNPRGYTVEYEEANANFDPCLIREI